MAVAMLPTKVINHAANQSIRDYSTNQEYLSAMREDLAEWLKVWYHIHIDSEIHEFQSSLSSPNYMRYCNQFVTCFPHLL